MPPRFVSETPLSPADFQALAARRGATVKRYRKSGWIAARRSAATEEVWTRWRGSETRNTAAPGDYVVTALDDALAPLRSDRGEVNIWVIRAAKFPELYAPDPDGRSPSGGAEGALYRPRGVVDAFEIPEGFTIAAPWGETQSIETGYLLKSGDEVYGNHAETFRATYEEITDGT